MRRIALLTVLFAQVVFAQSGDLGVEIQNIAQSESNWEISFSYNISNNSQPGILLELPGELKVIPMQIQLNQTNLWLQNKDEISQSVIVVNWQTLPEGLQLLFAENQVAAGDQLLIKTMATLIRKEMNPGAAVQIRRVERVGETKQFSDQVLATTPFPAGLSKE
jgi:hypothetical protein